jgi:uncharacterized protein (DUF58 family)
MNLKEVERIVGGIKNQLFRNSNSFSVGMLKSHFKGAGIQFKEHQVYNPGDDVRFIDWKLSAKTSHTFVKTFEEERNVEIIVFLDVSDTMFMGYENVSKFQAALELTSLLFLLAEKSKDLVRVAIMTEKLKILPPLSGHKGISLLISELEKAQLLNENGKVNFISEKSRNYDQDKCFKYLKNYIARGKEVVVFSDLYSLYENKDFNKLLYRKNLHCFRILSPVDINKKIPFSLFSSFKIGGRGYLTSTNKENKDKLEQGRWKELLVSERYLEDFVRNML